MPDNPNTWIQALNQLPAEVGGALMAIFIAVLRVIYDKEETQPMRVILESLICGALSLTISYAIIALGLNINWAIFAGGTIGYFGSATVRVFALKVVRAKIGGNNK